MSSLGLQPAIITIFGITGDLAKRKLLPALYDLYKDGIIPDTTRIVGVTRSGTTTEKVLETIQEALTARGEEVSEPVMKLLAERIHVVTMDITEHAEYVRLKRALDDIEDEVGVCLTRVFYLAIPSTMFDQVVDRLGKQDLQSGCQHGSADSRLLIEKPFGYDLQSARELVSRLQSTFSEQQIYRIDHYLAKETVQNILTFRFQNPLFKHRWDASSISHIMVTAAESIGIEGRVVFYEQIGAMRDLIQSHLLQLVALLTMEEPEKLDDKSIHAQKEAVFTALQPPAADQMAYATVRGQYEGYRDEVEHEDSQTETYAAVALSIENDRWRGVPILIRTGKALADKVTEITIVFSDKTSPSLRNTLTVRIQPNEGIVLDMRIKRPGFDDQTEHVQMDFCYGEQAGLSAHPDAYERVLVDALRGDKTLFATDTEVLESWRISEPILQAWASGRVPLQLYQKGSWGPDAAGELAERHDTQWLTDILHICRVHPPK